MVCYGARMSWHSRRIGPSRLAAGLDLDGLVFLICLVLTAKSCSLAMKDCKELACA